MQANRNALGPWEWFYTYKTSAAGNGLAHGDQYIAIKSAHFHKYVVNDVHDLVNCNRVNPGPWEKWAGWTKPGPWTV